MRTIYEIDNSKLMIFFDFIFSKCKKVSFKRHYIRGIIEDMNIYDENRVGYYQLGYIEKNEFDKIQEEFKEAYRKIFEDQYEEGYYTSLEELNEDYEELMNWGLCDYDRDSI